MNFFRINDISSSADAIRRFSGLVLKEDKADGELASAMNVSCDLYPFLTNAGGTYRLKTEDGAVRGMCRSDKLFIIVSNGAAAKAYFGGADTGMVMADGEKRCVRMGTKILIFPDKLWYDTSNGESGSLEAFFESAEGVTVRCSLTDVDGEMISYAEGRSEPESPASGTFWYDTSQSPGVMKVRSDGGWSEVMSVWTKISCPSVGLHFKSGDGVRISFSGEPLGGGYHVIESVGDDFIVIPGIYTELSGTVKVERRVPDTDFEIECSNRIWACRYGFNIDGDFVNEIYASKLGDPENFECFEGLSSDSYAVSLGSDGAFSGAASHLGLPIFFKEKCIHKIYGTRPSDFSLVTVEADGPRIDCSGSLCNVKDGLCFVSSEGVMLYDGAFPRCISEKLGCVKIRNAVCAVLGDKLMISALFDYEPRTLILDMSKMMWCEREYVAFSHTASLGHSLIISAGAEVLTVGDAEEAAMCAGLTAGSVTDVSPYGWSFETGNLSPMTSEYVYKVLLRMKVAQGASVSVFARYEDGGAWRSVGTISPCVETSYSIPVHTHRTDSFALRFEGHGGFILYSIARFTDRVTENTVYHYGGAGGGA